MAPSLMFTSITGKPEIMKTDNKGQVMIKDSAGVAPIVNLKMHSYKRKRKWTTYAYEQPAKLQSLIYIVMIVLVLVLIVQQLKA